MNSPKSPDHTPWTDRQTGRTPRSAAQCNCLPNLTPVQALSHALANSRKLRPPQTDMHPPRPPKNLKGDNPQPSTLKMELLTLHHVKGHVPIASSTQRIHEIQDHPSGCDPVSWGGQDVDGQPGQSCHRLRGRDGCPCLKWWDRQRGNDEGVQHRQGRGDAGRRKGRQG